MAGTEKESACKDEQEEEEEEEEEVVVSEVLGKGRGMGPEEKGA